MDPSIIIVKGLTAASKVESYVAIYDHRGREKGVAIAGGKGSWF